MENIAASTSPATARAPSAAQAAEAPDNGQHLLLAADGRALAANWFEPAEPARAVAVVSGATGAPRGYYRAFAKWLSSRGYAVLTYDYRGIGGSRQGPIRREKATMRDWALLDMPAALAAAQARRVQRGGRLPLLLVGHSFGGNSIAFAEGVAEADAMVAVGSQLGEPRLFPGRHRWLAELYFRAVLPAALALHGHAPRWASGGEPLPRAVAQDWADWGLMHGWAFADPRLRAHRQASAIVAPVHLWNVSDDLTYAPPRAVDALAAQFRNAAVQRHTLQPREVGQSSLGHFGVFRRNVGAAAWQRLLAPIEAATPSLRA